MHFSFPSTLFTVNRSQIPLSVCISVRIQLPLCYGYGQLNGRTNNFSISIRYVHTVFSLAFTASSIVAAADVCLVYTTYHKCIFKHAEQAANNVAAPCWGRAQTDNTQASKANLSVMSSTLALSANLFSHAPMCAATVAIGKLECFWPNAERRQTQTQSQTEVSRKTWKM